MSATTIQQMADRVAQLMQDRLHLKGRSLDEKLRRGGRQVPRRLRAPARFLADAADLAQNPRLAMQIDSAAVAEAYDRCIAALGGSGRAGRWMTWGLNRLATIVLSLMVLAALIVLVLRWRHMI
jgi:hypothetical protein